LKAIAIPHGVVTENEIFMKEHQVEALYCEVRQMPPDRHWSIITIIILTSGKILGVQIKRNISIYRKRARAGRQPKKLLCNNTE